MSNRDEPAVRRPQPHPTNFDIQPPFMVSSQSNERHVFSELGNYIQQNDPLIDDLNTNSPSESLVWNNFDNGYDKQPSPNRPRNIERELRSPLSNASTLMDNMQPNQSNRSRSRKRVTLPPRRNNSQQHEFDVQSTARSLSKSRSRSRSRSRNRYNNKDRYNRYVNIGIRTLAVNTENGLLAVRSKRLREKYGTEVLSQLMPHWAWVIAVTVTLPRQNEDPTDRAHVLKNKIMKTVDDLPGRNTKCRLNRWLDSVIKVEKFAKNQLKNYSLCCLSVKSLYFAALAIHHNKWDGV